MQVGFEEFKARGLALTVTAETSKQTGFEEYKARGEAFVQSINSDYETIPNSKGMYVLRNVVKLETAENYDVLIRSITEKFWRACIDTVDTKNMRLRVCAVGTPGIGKTSTTPILIRMLLKAGKTVVYIVRKTQKEKGWYYEFTPNTASGNSTISTMVYPEISGGVGMTSLDDPSTYYVVDPGETKDSCNPDTDFKAKVIIVSSPDNRHWGDSGFEKLRDSVRGFFMYYPL
jgi:hypothetical protein